jgi:RND family efflux transporter MFP subunit
MNKTTKISLIVSAVALITIGTTYAAKSVLAGNGGETQEVGTTTQGQNTSTSDTTQPSTHVTVETLSTDKTGLVTVLGTVKAVDQIKVFPGTAGQVTSVKVKEGDVVKKGDVILEIGGINGTKHQIQSQLELAETNYKNAQKGVNVTKSGNTAALKAAQIQLQSAKNQAAGTGIDLNVINRNIEATNDGVSIIQNSLDATRYKNEQDFQKTQNSIDSLRQAQQELQQKRQETFPDLYNKLAQTDDATARATIEATIQTTSEEFDKQSKALDDQLNTAMIGYETLRAGAQLSENQVLSQLTQSQAQIDVLNLNRESAATKLGYDGTTTDAVHLAEESVAATKVKNDAAIIQAQGQVDVAKINLDLAKNQQEALIVRAPNDGIVGEIATRAGDMVSSQAAVTQIINTNEYELKVGVNVDDAQKIGIISKAEVQIGDRYVPVWIKSISPIADPTTKLVTVTLGLPHIFFRANQTLSAHIDFMPSTQTGKTTVSVPLDALIIGTEEKYVFINDNGKAKKMNVTVGEINGSYAEILDGLNANDQVIVNHAKDLIDGQSITID